MKTICSKRQLQKLRNLSTEMSIRRFHFRKMLFCIYYKGRILATEKINATCEMSIVMKDLWSNTFFVAVIYKLTSSKQYSKNKIHWYSDAAKHSGVETVWRYILKLRYIMHDRDLVKKVKKNCERGRYLRKKAINTEMGPVLSHSLRIALAFNATQVKVCVPFKTYSPHNKRTGIKIWFAVYCCMSTSTT